MSDTLPATQSSDATERRLANLKPFPPGVSGNPGGRSKGLQRRVRELVGDDGDKLAQFLFDVVSDTSEKTGERIEAAKILLERGWGKAPIAIETDSPATFVLLSAFAAMAQHELDEDAT
jgi:hypothetical protein